MRSLHPFPFASSARGNIIRNMRTAIRDILLLALLLCFARAAEAVIYQYFDEEGTLIVTNVPDLSKKPFSQKEEIYHNVALKFRDDVSYEFYPVTGGTFQEAVMNANMTGPIETKDNRRYAAQTRWKIGWSYKLDSTYRIEDNRVRASMNLFDVEIKADIVVLLPALSGQTAFSEHDMALWEQFVQGLLDHEHDHVALIKEMFFRDEATRRIAALRELTLDYVPGMAVGEAIKKTVESRTAEIGHDLIREIRARNDEYDRLTGHGLKPEMRRIFFR
jgi:predicted secreted Zn-dependent protease